jgi:HEAT repeat protein
MPSHRDEVIAALARFAGPLGPLTSLDEHLDRLDHWVAQASPDTLAALASIVDSPPDPLPAPPDDWEVVIVEVAGRVGAAHRDAAMTHLLPLLDRSHARAVAADILGSVGDPRALAPLAALLASANLTEDERIRIADALADIQAIASR